jgi:hypothetical protein
MFKCFKRLEHVTFASAQHAATVFDRTTPPAPCAVSAATTTGTKS